MLAALLLTTVLGGSVVIVDPAVETPRERGAEVFREKACFTCHSTDGAKSPAPTMKGLWGSVVRLGPGKTVTADEAYVRESILKPGARVVQGYLPIMPIYKDVLSAKDVDALVEFIRGLATPDAG